MMKSKGKDERRGQLQELQDYIRVLFAHMMTIENE